MKLKIVSLFSGCGGLDEGFRLAGDFDVVWANDIYEPSCKTFSKNSGLPISNESITVRNSIFFGDIEKADFSNIADPYEIDVITGGPPCQDFSVIRGSGNRKGIQVKRGRLYVHFVRALATLQPKFFVFENVKGLISANQGQAYKQIKEDFQNLNLRWHSMWKDHKLVLDNFKNSRKLQNFELLFEGTVNFSALGVPQKRLRAIIIGIRKDLADNMRSVFEVKEIIRKILKGENDILSIFPLTPIEVFTGKPLNELGDYYKDIIQNFNEVEGKISSERSKYYFSKVRSKLSLDIWNDYLSNCNHLATIDEEEKKDRIIERHTQMLDELGYLGRPVDKLNLADISGDIRPEGNKIIERMKFIPPGENHEFVRNTPHHVIGLMSNIYKRIFPIKIAPTVIARGGGGTWGYHYLRDRQRMTNRERARLQTFPDSFLFEGGPGQIRRQIGEAVPAYAGKVFGKIIKYTLNLCQ